MEKNSSNRLISSQNKSGTPSDKSNNAGQESKQISSSAAAQAIGSSSSQSAPSPAPVSSKAKSVSSSYEKSEKRSSGRSNYNNANFKGSEHGGAFAFLGSTRRSGFRISTRIKKGNAVCDFVEFAYEKRRGGGGGYDGSGGGRASGGGRYNNPRAENYARHYVSRNRHVSASYGPSYNKEQYLQATCQFIVMDGFNYGAHLSDADLIVDWDHIEELRLLVDEIPSCPICLYPPIAAKITRCGHVFCWPCILHYLALSDKTWRKCPICYESVYKNQLKSVIALKVDHLNIGGEVKMSLMRREKGSNVVLPITEPIQQQRQIKHIDGENGQFSKLLTITRAQVIEYIVERERTALLVKLSDEEHEPEACFIREALDTLQEREKYLKIDTPRSEKSPAVGSPPIVSPFSNYSRHTAGIVTYVDAFNDEKRSGGSCSVRSAQSAPAGVTASGRLSSTGHNGSIDGFPEETEQSGMESLAAAATAVSTMNDKFYYFYQAEDGQQVYLHPVNARCFVHQYGSLAAAPEIITGEIAEMESFVMTEDLRRRFRYLAHLPLTTTFTLVELKLSRDLLSDETVEQFAVDLAKREDARQRKAKEEKRQQTHAERWERAIMLDPRNIAKYATSRMEPPEIPVTTYVPSAQRDIEASFNSDAIDGVSNSSPPSGSSPPLALIGEGASSTPSFAQMLKQGKPKPNSQPAVQQTAWPDLRSANGATDGDGELDDDQKEFLHLHSFQDAFGDALQSALDSYKSSTTTKIPTEEPIDEEVAVSVAGKKKKKKTKGRLLFATGAAAPGLH